MRLYNKIAWAVRWLTLGDSKWLAVEGDTYAEIQNTHWTVDSFLPIKHNMRFVESRIEAWFPTDPESTGYISDDTVFTLAWLQSLINKRALDIYDLFEEHNKFLEKFGPAGCGSGTLASLSQIKSGRSPLEAGQHSRGNGVLMKQFPYALYFRLFPTSTTSMDKQIETIAQCTHVTPVAKLTAIVHNRMLYNLLHRPASKQLDWELFLDCFQTLSSTYEASAGYTEGLRNPDETISVAEIIGKLKTQYESIQQWNPYSLEQIIATYKVKGDNPDAKYGFHVATTFGFVYSIFLQRQDWQWLLDAINIGEDTDTQAAIIGNMIWAYKGEFYDKSLLRQLKNKQEIAEILEATAKAFLK